MGYTLAEARVRARTDLLDDPDGLRWTDAEMDRHLKSAHGRVTDWFIRKGSKVFRNELSQAAVLGVVDLSAVLPSKVVRVTLNSGGHQSIIPHVPLKNKVNTYTGTDTVSIYYDAVPAFPSADGDALIDDVNTFVALEDLIVARAIESASIKDGEIPTGFISYLRRLEKDVLMNQGTKRTQKPSPPSGSRGLSWSYDYAAQAVVLSHNAY